jgi:cation diffusion facilitator CzcD-associated flavoprotein CzcO
MDTQLLVVGAGPYGLSTASFARENGIDTVVLGRPMAFWREHMPAEMFLRSGPDWHLDPAGVHTLEAYLEERGIAQADVDPIPIGLFLDYAAWFERSKGIPAQPDYVEELTARNGGFEATLAGGERIRAEAVVCAPGITHYATVPDWAAAVPPGLGTHTCELVSFDELGGKRVLVVGGRQSAYEWAALLREHGAARVDVVHRHPAPRFEKVSWRFIDPHIELTLQVPGYWRGLSQAERDAVAQRFWEVGRLTLEHWLISRLAHDEIRVWPRSEVAEVEGGLTLRLSGGERIEADAVVFACGYRADLTKVPYLDGVIGEIDLADGFPLLDEAMQTSIPGLYVTGFSATRDFGPFFGFVRGAPAAGTLIVRNLLARG